MRMTISISTPRTSHPVAPIAAERFLPAIFLLLSVTRVNVNLSGEEGDQPDQEHRDDDDRPEVDSRPHFFPSSFVELRGIEPRTCCLPGRCSTAELQPR